MRQKRRHIKSGTHRSPARSSLHSNFDRIALPRPLRFGQETDPCLDNIGAAVLDCYISGADAN